MAGLVQRFFTGLYQDFCNFCTPVVHITGKEKDLAALRATNNLRRPLQWLLNLPEIRYYSDSSGAIHYIRQPMKRTRFRTFVGIIGGLWSGLCLFIAKLLHIDARPHLTQEDRPEDFVKGSMLEYPVLWQSALKSAIESNDAPKIALLFSAAYGKAEYIGFHQLDTADHFEHLADNVRAALKAGWGQRFLQLIDQLPNSDLYPCIEQLSAVINDQDFMQGISILLDKDLSDEAYHFVHNRFATEPNIPPEMAAELMLNVSAKRGIESTFPQLLSHYEEQVAIPSDLLHKAFTSLTLPQPLLAEYEEKFGTQRISNLPCYLLNVLNSPELYCRVLPQNPTAEEAIKTTYPYLLNDDGQTFMAMLNHFETAHQQFAFASRVFLNAPLSDNQLLSIADPDLQQLLWTKSISCLYTREFVSEEDHHRLEALFALPILSDIFHIPKALNPIWFIAHRHDLYSTPETYQALLERENKLSGQLISSRDEVFEGLHFSETDFQINTMVLNHTMPKQIIHSRFYENPSFDYALTDADTFFSVLFENNSAHEFEAAYLKAQKENNVNLVNLIEYGLRPKDDKFKAIRQLDLLLNKTFAPIYWQKLNTEERLSLINDLKSMPLPASLCAFDDTVGENLLSWACAYTTDPEQRERLFWGESCLGEFLQESAPSYLRNLFAKGEIAPYQALLNQTIHLALRARDSAALDLLMDVNNAQCLAHNLRNLDPSLRTQVLSQWKMSEFSELLMEKIQEAFEITLSFDELTPDLLESFIFLGFDVNKTYPTANEEAFDLMTSLLLISDEDVFKALVHQIENETLLLHLVVLLCTTPAITPEEKASSSNRLAFTLSSAMSRDLITPIDLSIPVSSTVLPNDAQRARLSPVLLAAYANQLPQLRVLLDRGGATAAFCTTHHITEPMPAEADALITRQIAHEMANLDKILQRDIAYFLHYDFEERADNHLLMVLTFAEAQNIDLKSAINMASSQGETLLHQFVAAGNPTMVRALLNFGADPQLCDNNGLSAIALCIALRDQSPVIGPQHVIQVILETDYATENLSSDDDETLSEIAESFHTPSTSIATSEENFEMSKNNNDPIETQDDRASLLRAFQRSLTAASIVQPHELSAVHDEPSPSPQPEPAVPSIQASAPSFTPSAQAQARLEKKRSPNKEGCPEQKRKKELGISNNRATLSCS